MPPRFAIARTVLALAWTAPVLAHEPADRLEPVTVSAVPDAPLGTDDAASRGAVDAARIQARPMLRPADVLEWVPGLVVTQHSGDGKANQYFLRGFNLDHGTDFATSVAGVPVNLPTHAHGHGYTDLNFLVPEWVERVSWRKGPYAAQDGDFSAAGAADIALRSQLSRPMAQVTLGGNGYRRLLGAASPHVGDGHLLLGVEALVNDGPWDVAQDARRMNLLARWSTGTAANGGDVTLMGYRARWTATDQVPQRALDAGLISRFGSLDPTTGGETSRWSLSGSLRRALDDGGRVELSAWALRYRLNLWSNFTYALDRPDTGDQFEQADDRVAAGLRAARTWRTTLGGVPTQTVVGLQARQDRVDLGLYDTQGRTRLDTVRADRVAATQAGVFAEHTSFWTDRVRTIAGLRVDRQSNRVDASRPENGGTSGATLVSPKLALVVTPADTVETYASVGRGFHSNDARGTTARVDPRTGDAVLPVRPLVPALGHELGVRWAPAGGFVLSAAAWWLAIDSELVFVGDAGITEPSRASRRRGVEVNARWMPRPWLAIDADLALSRARFVDDDPAGPHVPGSVDRVASVGVSIVGLGPWSAGARLRHIGPRPLVEDGSVRSAAATSVDARLGYRLSPRLDLLFDAFNLLGARANDIEYFYRSRLAGEPAAGLDDRHLHPAEPRTLRISLRATF